MERVALYLVFSKAVHCVADHIVQLGGGDVAADAGTFALVVVFVEGLKVVVLGDFDGLNYIQLVLLKALVMLVL